MNKKATTYLLLSLVLSIWGFVGYKIYRTVYGQGDINIANNNNNNIANNNKVEDTFSLLLNYADPFTKSKYANNDILNTDKVSTNNHVSFSINKPTLNNQDISKASIPLNIKYFGLVKNESKKTGMLSLNGKSYLVVEEQKIDSIQVIKFAKSQLLYKDSKNKLTTIYVE